MPASRLHSAKVLVHKPAGRGYYRLVLRAPDAAAAARPGQFVMLRVSENMDPILARPFGIAGLPSKTSLEIYYRVVGRGTELLASVEPGRMLSMQGPIGNGFSLPAKDTLPLFVAGGSGFPPLLYFASTISRQAVFFLGAREKDCLPPAQAIKSCRKHTKKVYIATDDGSAGMHGLVTDLLSTYLAASPEKARIIIFACGPRAMMAAAARIAADHAVPCYVSMEERMACGVGACMGCSVAVKSGGYKRVCKEGPVFEGREIDWSEQVVLPVPHKK